MSTPAKVCGKKCDHGSECLQLPGHDGGHITQHGCVFYDVKRKEELVMNKMNVPVDVWVIQNAILIEFERKPDELVDFIMRLAKCNPNVASTVYQKLEEFLY